MKKGLIIFILIFNIISASNLYAASSTISITDGSSCMGDDKSKKQTEQTAIAEAKRTALENAKTYIKSETHIKDYEFEKDLVAAYANGTVNVIEKIEAAWYKDPSSGDCYKVKLKVEIVPDEEGMKKASQNQASADPSAPLNVSVWTDKQDYKQSEKVKIYLKSNKPFFARMIYKDASGNILQLLPNPYRQDNYFNGGVVYEFPSGQDKFELEVSPPFGAENIIVYTSTAKLGDISVKSAGSVYSVNSTSEKISEGSRGVNLVVNSAEGSNKNPSAEFFESSATIKTLK